MVRDVSPRDPNQSLSHSSPLVRSETVDALSPELVSSHVLRLIDMLRTDEDWVVRASVAERLGAVRSEIVVEALLAAMTDESDDVRAYAALSLGRVGDASTADELRRLLSTESERVCMELLGALYRLGDDDALRRLLETEAADEETAIWLSNILEDLVRDGDATRLRASAGYIAARVETWGARYPIVGATVTSITRAIEELTSG